MHEYVRNGSLALLVLVACDDGGNCVDPPSTTGESSTGGSPSSGANTAPTSAGTTSGDGTSGGDTSGGDTSGGDDSSTDTSAGDSSGGDDTGGEEGCTPQPISWNATSPLPTGYATIQAAIVGDTLFALAGTDDTGASDNIVYAAIIGDDGELGDWVEQASLPVANFGTRVVTVGDRLVVTGSDMLQQTAVFAHVADAGTGSVNQWVPMASTPPTPTVMHGNFASAGRVYLVGGFQNLAGMPQQTATVFSAPLFGDGIVGSWDVHSNALPAPSFGSRTAVLDETLWVIGGSTTFPDPLPGSTRVETAAVLPGGGISAFSSGPVLPAGRVFHAVVALDGRLLVTGGFETSDTDIRAEGWVLDEGAAQWSDDAPLPSPRAGHAMVADERFVFVLGGRTGPGASTDEVLVAEHCGSSN